MNTDDLVLIAIINNGRDLHIAMTEHWYRIPVKSAPKRLEDTSYLAFYLTRAFGDQKWSIPYWAKIEKCKIVKRSELLPHESDHPKADENYYKLEIDELKKLPEPIISKRGRRITFITTTLKIFKSAKEINDLFNESPLEDKVWEEFKNKGIEAERQYYVAEGKTNYCLDFAIFCKDGNIDTECDGDTWHSQSQAIVSDNERNNFLTSRGWSVLRFSSKDITENMTNCIGKVKYTLNNLGGLATIDGKFLEIRDEEEIVQLELFDND